MKKFLLYISSLFFLTLFLLLFLSITYNTSESVPKGFYLPIKTPLEKGVYVKICPPAREPFLTAYKRHYINVGVCPDQMRYLLKKVAALNGDTISMRDNGLFINGRLYKDSIPFQEDLYHRPFPIWRIENYKLKENEILLMGENPASYDGRYFGLLSKNDIISVMRPLWTW